MLSPKIAILFAGLVILPATAVAATPLEYDCDTAAGSFSQLKQAGLPGKPIPVRGTVAARQFRTDERWAPGAAISVEAADGDMIMIRVAAAERGEGPLTLELLTTLKGKDTTQVLGSVPNRELVAFSIVPTLDGFAVTLGGQQRQISFVHDQALATSVSCSTGEFIYTDLRFGN